MRALTSADDRGSMAVEVVVLVPVLVALMLLVVAFGRYVSAEGDVQALARDGARAATLERDATAAARAAQDTVAAATPPSLTCEPATMRGAFVRGGRISVEVRCSVPLDDLGLIGLPGSVDVSATSTAPLDTRRRTGGGP